MIGYSQFLLEYYFVIITLVMLFFIPHYSKSFWDISLKSYFNNNKNRIKSIDTIKGIAIIGVIIIHSCYFLLDKYTSYSEVITLTLINNIFRFSIPVFLFSSGFLLKEFVWKSKNIAYFYINKFLRIGIPYIIINLFLWKIGYNSSASFWYLLITGDMAIPFYFIPVLFQLYLLYPILDYFRKISPKYLLLISLIISIISFFTPSTWQINGFPLFTQYLIFFVYGMLKKDILQKKSSKIWAELLFIYIVLQIIMSISAYFIMNQYMWKLIYFYNFQIILGFGFIFTILSYLESKKIGYKIIQKIFAPIGIYSLWIFLLHFPIQENLFILTKNFNLPLLIFLSQNIILTLILTIPIAFILNYIYSSLRFKMK